MKVYYCGACGSLVFFENVKCLQCGHALGFVPSLGQVIALEPAENGVLRRLSSTGKEQLYRRCDNGQKYGICNWLVPAEEATPLCVSCRLNRVIPDLKVSGNLDLWGRIEIAKRRVIYTLVKLVLPTESSGNNGVALRFSFLGDVPGQLPVRTGHDNGLITLNIAEADDVDRERRRVTLHEPYRTLVGHFRHEIGHYYWLRLIAGTPRLAPCRTLFGDETVPYEQTLMSYYDKGPPGDWQSRHVSAYASAHPWEDWAETWAHYLHIIDTIETAAGFGMVLKPRHPSAKAMNADPGEACGVGVSFDAILGQWFPLVCALNSLNRGMGLHDLYPFSLSGPAIDKLRFVHDVVQTNQCPGAPPAT